jgi:hypothetical protein
MIGIFANRAINFICIMALCKDMTHTFESDALVIYTVELWEILSATIYVLEPKAPSQSLKRQ